MTDQYACCVAVGVTWEIGIIPVTEFAIASTYGSDISFCSIVGQGGIDGDIHMTCGTGSFVEVYWVVSQVAGANAIWRIKNLAGPSSTVIGGIDIRHEPVGDIVAVIARLCV